MYSCKKHRTAAYDEDLQGRMIYQTVGMRNSYRRVACALNVDISTALNVDISTVQRTVKLFTETGAEMKISSKY